MAKKMEIAVSYKFVAHIDGKDYGITSVSPISKIIKANGRTMTPPVVLERAVHAEDRSFAEIFGNRPKERRHIRVEEMSNAGGVIRTIHLSKCKFLSMKISRHDAVEEGVVIDTIKLRPGRITVRHNRENLDG